MNHKRLLELIQAIRTAESTHMLSCYHWRLTGCLEFADMTWEEKYRATILGNSAYSKRFDELMSEMYGKKAA